jgi:acetylornithine deacetylase
VTNLTHLNAVEWLRRLVGYRTVVGESNLELIEDVSAYLTSLGFESMLIPGTREGTANLCATIGPAGRSGIVLSAHTDVVAADCETWASDPFCLTQRGSRLFGRGATDMKGFIAAVLATLPRLVDLDLCRALTLALSADEELGVQGVGPMLDVLAQSAVKPAFCVVGEPTNMRVAVAHKGKIAFRVKVHGRAIHSSAAPSGVSAIAAAADFINEIYSYQSALATHTRDPRFAVPYSSLNVGHIEGGTSVNVVAEWCVFDVEIRALPQQDLSALLRPLLDSAELIERHMRANAPEASVSVEVLSQYPGLDMAGDVPQLVAELSGTDHGLAVDFGTEAGLYCERLEVPVVVCGPGDVAQAHTVDEYIEHEQLVHAENFVRRIADWLC